MRMKAFDRLIELVAILRGVDGCPWDRAQSIQSLKRDLLSEADEVAQAIEKADYANLREEIGDVIWAAALMTQVAADEGRFTMQDVLDAVNAKIVYRHPHVFGDAKAATADEARQRFNEAKRREKQNHSSGHPEVRRG
jgi:tetrapyrrole methylase family protein/MazG family protein